MQHRPELLEMLLELARVLSEIDEQTALAINHQDYRWLNQQEALAAMDTRLSSPVLPKKLNTFIEELSRFADALNKVMKGVRKGAKEKQGQEEKQPVDKQETS